MVLPISIALSLSILYRITINLPDLPYSAELRRAGSDDFLETSKHLNQVVDQLLQNLPGEHRSSVNKFSYHQVIGTLATFDIYSDENSEYVRQAFLKAIEKGFIGHYAVSSDGFELHVIQASNTNCSALEFPCSDGTCISSKLQCDHSRDCPDGSDESAKFAHCKHHIPVIYQTDKIFSVPVGGVAHLSAIIDMLEENHQVIWTRHSNIIGENSLVLSDDDRISLSHSKDEYFLRIKNVVESDAGEYSIQIQGLPVNATFEIRITADAIPKESDECPEGERACKSGHCLPVSQFCDRITQCPDGDDEMNCTAVVCSSTEIRCLSNNVCVPASARCDGWKDCQDASDEEGCPAATTSRPITHGNHKKHSRLTVTCEDGSAPEYSLHGSTYCWSNSVCPTSTVCVQGLCCATGRNEKRSVVSSTGQCASEEFRCDDGACIPQNRQCDRHYDCSDGSDETKCGYYVEAMKAHANQTQDHGHNDHQQGQHHASHHESSHHAHARDPNIECTDQEFRCPYLTEVKCFHYDKLCDGVDDCGDGSDEVNCESGSKEEKDEVEPSAEAASDNEGCTSNQFKCDDGRCIESSLACNHKYDCDDGTDETHCEYFKAAMARRAESTTDNEHNNVDNNNNNNNVNNNNNNHEAELRRREEELRRREHEESRRQEELKRREEAEHQREEELRHREDSERDREDELRHREDELRRREDEERRRHEEERRQEDEDRRRDDEHRQHQEQERRRLHEEQVRRQEEEDRRNNEDALRRQHEQHSRRQEEESRHNQEEIRRRQEQAQEAHEQEERRRLEEHRRQLEEERSRVHELPKPIHHPHEDSTGISNEVIFKEYEDEVLCLDHEFACGTGECIDRRRVCDTRPDCLDSSDEDNCADRRPEDLPAFHEHIEDEIVDEEDQVPQIANGHIQPHHHESYDDRIAQEHQMEMHPAQPSQPMRQHEHQSATYYHQDIDQSGANDVQITIYPTEASVRDGRDVTFDCRARTADNSVYPSVRWTRAGGPLPPNAHETGGRLTLNPVSLEDSGRYICTATHNGQTVEAHSILNVQSYGPQDVQGLMPNNGACMADEKACGNNECVKAEYVCDGEPDCRDRSDEENCPALRSCEPNEFKCANQRCVQKMWLCDGDDDCGDGSDELNCGGQQPGDLCKATEFQCADRRQCVPTSFHCDGTNDCRDGSDEVGCVQPTVVEPPETNKQVPIGETFRLTCKAVGVPEPYINWRLNWGPVCEPPRCLQSSEGGQGTLTVTNAQPADQGAYTCEAINVKGRVLATPDCIVRIVNIPSPTLPPRPAPTPSCDTRGSVSPYPDGQGNCQCKPQVTGPNCDTCRPGSFHLSPKSPQGCLKCFCFGITDQCRSSSYYRTKDRLMFDGDAEGVTISDIGEREIDRNSNFEFTKQGYLTLSGAPTGTKYWRLPQRFLGDKVTAYGGKMEFEVEYSGSGSLSQEPLVVLKGNQMILVHRVRNQDQVLRSDSPVRITVETYETSYEQLNGAPATREDLLMVLADLDAFLIRATHTDSQYTSSLGDVSWEIAVDRQTQDGMALEVEQCSCPPGYIGTSCEDCAPGYERSGHGPFLGTCVPMQQRTPQCTGVGAASPQAGYGGRCQCKTYAQGPNCDQCAANSFYMAPSNPQGCIPCFCSGVTQQCQSSSYSRTNVEIDYRRGDRDQLTLSSSDSRQPFTPQTPGYVSGSAIEFSSFHEANGQTLYWKMPEKFLGNKVTAYGGNLKFTFRYSGEGNTNRDPHIILRGNDISLQYTHREPTSPDRDNTIEIKLFEDKWQRVDGQQATREHLLMALADLDSLLIKATYIDDCSQSSLIHVSFEFAEPYGRGGMTALEVEQCQCPPGYVGTSCEDCAPGYSRTGGGLYLGLCEKCECHGHASTCDKEYGFCVDCQHNTEGDQCHRCKPGFVGDARRGTPHDCQPAATRPPCQCNNHSPRGCDSFGRCLLCEHNTEGTHCERCKKGFYGDATKGTPFDCTPCPCPGTSDCYLDQQGQVACRNCPAGLSGRLCNECAPGYTRSNKEAGRICEPIGSVTNNDRTYVPSPPEGGRPPQPHIDPPHQTVMEGDAASFRCWVPEIPDCQITFHKEHIGGPLPHGVYQTGNALKIPRAMLKDAGNYICTAINQYGIGQSPNARLDVIRPAQRPKVDPIEQTVNEGEPARFRCWVPGNNDVQLKWNRIGNQPLPSGVQEQQGILYIPSTSHNEIGQYVCTATDPKDGKPQESDPVSLNLRKPDAPPQLPQVDPPEQTVNEGDPAQFRCWVPGNPHAQLRWTKESGEALPEGTLERDGYLRLNNAQMSDAGRYICTATDPRTGAPSQAPPATLNVKKDAAPIVPQVDPQEQTVNEGEPSRIRCFVPGNPEIQLRWTKERRQPLQQGASERDGVLTISKTMKEDEGNYLCMAIDPNTRQPIEAPLAKINVKAPLKPLVDPSEQTIPEGSPFRIRCWVPGHPDAELSWRKAEGTVNDLADERQGHLTVHQAQQTDDGDYICSVNDPTTGEPIDSDPATVHVTSTAKPPVVDMSDKSPEISPPHQKVPTGDDVTIKCWVEGDPAAQLTFTRVDGTPLPFGSSEQNGILSIPNAQPADEGDYVCTYHPSEGQPKESTISRLDVESKGQPPRPVASPAVQTVRRGTPARFTCVAHSATPARISWTFGDETTPLPSEVRRDGDDIIIDQATEHLVGSYVCTATNHFGRGVAEPVRLEITDDEQPPTARVEPRTWNGKPGDRHQFKCIVTGVPTPKVVWTGPNGTPLPHDVTPLEDNILDFAHGRTELNGDYTCTATNPVGEASDHGVVNIGPSLTVKTTPAGPRLVLTVGEPLLVKCEAFGEPEPEVEWLHDPGPERGDLPDDYKPVTISEQFIRHPAIGLGNAGLYTCKGSNSHATATKDIYIEVVEPSRVATVSILGGSTQWFEQGEPSELICTATGSSLVDRLEWVKVDDQLPTDVEEHNEPGLLHFPNFKNSYAGEYECRGYRHDELIATSAVTVHSASLGQDDAKVEVDPPRVRVINQGDSIVLRCSVTGAKNGENFEWALLRGGNIVRKLGTEATLTINKADPTNDFGVYRCNVEDDNGMVIGSAYTAVTVGYSNKQNAQITKFDEHSDASFVCPVYSVPGSKVEWSRDDGELPSNAQPNGNKLEIKDFDDKSSGLYICSVHINDRVVEGYVHAQIFVPDTIIQVLLEVSSENINVGERAWFDCKVTGDPSAQISWYKDGADELPENSQVTGGRLLFTDITEDNAGTYRCVAKTKAGPLETRTVLNVGAAKRKRKHARRGRHARHQTRHAAYEAKEKEKQRSMFGNWFSTQ